MEESSPEKLGDIGDELTAVLYPLDQTEEMIFSRILFIDYGKLVKTIGLSQAKNIAETTASQCKAMLERQSIHFTRTPITMEDMSGDGIRSLSITIPVVDMTEELDDAQIKERDCKVVSAVNRTVRALVMNAKERNVGARQGVIGEKKKIICNVLDKWADKVITREDISSIAESISDDLELHAIMQKSSKGPKRN